MYDLIIRTKGSHRGKTGRLAYRTHNRKTNRPAWRVEWNKRNYDVPRYVELGEGRHFGLIHRGISSTCRVDTLLSYGVARMSPELVAEWNRRHRQLDQQHAGHREGWEAKQALREEIMERAELLTEDELLTYDLIRV